MPSIWRARSAACSGLRASFTPPPLPRPPAWICALITLTGLPPAISSRAAEAASSGVVASFPRGTATPNRERISLAWYSWIFIEAPRRRRRYTPPARGASRCTAPADLRQSVRLAADSPGCAGAAAPRPRADADARRAPALAGGRDRGRGPRQLVGAPPGRAHLLDRDRAGGLAGGARRQAGAGEGDLRAPGIVAAARAGGARSGVAPGRRKQATGARAAAARRGGARRDAAARRTRAGQARSGETRPGARRVRAHRQRPPRRGAALLGGLGARRAAEEGATSRLRAGARRAALRRPDALIAPVAGRRRVPQNALRAGVPLRRVRGAAAAGAPLPDAEVPVATRAPARRRHAPGGGPDRVAARRPGRAAAGSRPPLRGVGGVRRPGRGRGAPAGVSLERAARAALAIVGPGHAPGRARRPVQRRRRQPAGRHAPCLRGPRRGVLRVQRPRRRRPLAAARGTHRPGRDRRPGRAPGQRDRRDL